MYDQSCNLHCLKYLYHQANITKITDPYKQTKLTYLFKPIGITSVGGGGIGVNNHEIFLLFPKGQKELLENSTISITLINSGWLQL